MIKQVLEIESGYNKKSERVLKWPALFFDEISMKWTNSLLRTEHAKQWLKTFKRLYFFAKMAVFNLQRQCNNHTLEEIWK